MKSRFLRGPYCTIGVRSETLMKATPTRVWHEQRFGRDRALVHSDGKTTTAFALGPAKGVAKEPTRLSALLGDRVASLRFCHQVHGRTIHQIEIDTVPVSEVGPGDGLVTTAPGVGLMVWTADCVPVLLAGNRVVAATHSGWRGCAADVVGAAVEQMARHNNTGPESIRAALGPSVCSGCYEVGHEVLEALRSFDLAETRWLVGNRVDLRGFLTARLEAIGVPADHIETVGGCTVESPELASYRRDGAAAGRQWSMVFLNR